MTKTYQLIIFVTILLASVTIINCNKKTPLVYEERVVVTNRAAGTLSYIDPATDQVVQTQTIAGSEPMYIIYLPSKDRLLVGDRLQSKIHVINPATQTVETSIAVGSGVMHMSVDAQAKQLWAAGDLSNTLTVINLNTYTVEKTINIGIKPHDVFLSSDGTKAYVSVQPGVGIQDSIYVFSTATYDKQLSKAAGTFLHLYFSAVNNKLYVASQSGTFSVLDPSNLNQISSVTIPGAHGLVLSSDEKTAYIGNFVGDQLYMFNNSSNTLGSNITSTVTPPVHNIAVNEAGDKLYAAHSGASSQSVSVYTIQNGTFTQGPTITVGTNPNSLVYYKREVK
ncbi:MAG: YncE family protein [Chitinophagaceae bacterium]|nr:YncE family protein [Chitinophagaceae bacterium]